MIVNIGGIIEKVMQAFSNKLKKKKENQIFLDGKIERIKI